MQMETLGDAYTHGAKLWMACAWGPYTKGMKRGRECQFRADLDLMTLVCTRGRAFPISLLGSRLKCPRCGSTRVRVIWDLPTNSSRMAG